MTKRHSILAGVIAATLSSPPGFASDYVYSSDNNKAIVEKLFYEGFSGGNLRVIDELIGEDFILDDPNLPPGKEGLKAIVTKNNTSFSNWKFTIHDLLLDGDKVTARWTGSGVHVNSFMGEIPTNKVVSLHGISIYQIRDNKIVADWVIPDNLGFLKQLGVVQVEDLVQP